MLFFGNVDGCEFVDKLFKKDNIFCNCSVKCLKYNVVKNFILLAKIVLELVL